MIKCTFVFQIKNKTNMLFIYGRRTIRIKRYCRMAKTGFSLLLLLFPLFVVTLFTTCNLAVLNKQKESVDESDVDVYVVGWEVNKRGKYIAKLWINGRPQNLIGGQFANSVFVSDKDVYVVGTGKYNVVKLWKNGVAQNLTDRTSMANAYSIFVSDNDVYIAVYERNKKNIDVAKVWKNGVAQNLTDGTSMADAYSVFVSDNDVYVAGHERNKKNISVAIKILIFNSLHFFKDIISKKKANYNCLLHN